MAINYLQYIQSVPQEAADPADLRFLVSGADAIVHQTVGRNVLSAAHQHGKTVFLVDNTQNHTAMHLRSDPHRLVNVLDGEIGLCGNLLEANDLPSISRLRSLLSDLGFDGMKAMKIVSYLNFVKETERRLGNTSGLTVAVLEEYGSVLLVERKLEQLVANGMLSEDNYRYLLERYTEVSAAAADFELFLVLLAPFMGDCTPTSDTAVYVPVGDFVTDKPMQETLCKMLIFYLREHADNTAVLILDDGNGDRGFIVNILRSVPAHTELHLFSNDVFTLSDAEKDVVLNTFPARIYTRHGNMMSCQKIEALCGQMDVVKHSSTVSVDKRIRASSAWDVLFGTNRTETSIANAPVKDSRFRKEIIHTLPDGTAIVDYAGEKVPFSFLIV